MTHTAPFTFSPATAQWDVVILSSLSRSIVATASLKPVPTAPA